MRQPFIHIHTLPEIQEHTPTYLAIGNFDGVHRGHQVVLQRMVAAAKEAGIRTAVLTFFPHPKRVIRDTPGAYYITTLDDRVQQLAAQGIDIVITHPFDHIVRQTRAAEFVEQLCHYLGLKQLWGGNFALGYKREGDVPFLRRLGLTKGYTVELVEAMVEWNGELVSSSRVRRSLVNGEIEEVNGCLGRPYQLNGTVVMGDQRGRTIGFPTANLAIWDELILPANGVYATYAQVGQSHYIAATNVGVRPTVDGQKLTIEAHLLDFAGDLYDQPLTLSFISRIRPEMKFSGLDALKAQIDVDVVSVRQKLSNKNPSDFTSYK
jgi:riboflavin kinase / FMN adenylyltransferase